MLHLVVGALLGTMVSSWPTVEPFWPHHDTRRVQVLDGTWEYSYQDNCDLSTITPTNTKTTSTTTVPSTFDNAPPGVLGKRGTAFYRTRVNLTAGHPGLLYFSACSFYCKIWVDNVLLGDHKAGGYQPFSFPVLSNPTKTEREIFVLADNRWSNITAPTHTGGDFWQYGGITRNVLLHELPGGGHPYINRVEIIPKTDNVTTVLVRVFINPPPTTPKITLGFSWDKGPKSNVDLLVNKKSGVATLYDVSVPNPKVWTLQNPQLHLLTVSLPSGDTVTNRFGLRVVGNIGGRLTLNGKVVKLHGVNRHTMWPDTGSALTLAQVEQDVKLLKELGANYVRGAHYPQDQRFLDLCDESGIVVWEETLGPGVELSNLLNPYFLKYQVQAINEMIDASVNHPSVILFGFYNEGPSGQHGSLPGYNLSASTIRSRDTGRLVTWASNHKTRDVCLSVTDVISFNDYPAWYYQAGNISAIPVVWGESVAWAKKNFPEKAFTISETGAGGVWEYTNTTAIRWSQLYEKEVVEADTKFALGNDHVSGLTIWQFSDIKANDKSTESCHECQYIPGTHDCGYIDIKCGRPGGENHKGQVDFWRRKKQSFEALCKLYGGTKCT